MFPSKSDGMFVPESLIFRSDSNGEVTVIHSLYSRNTTCSGFATFRVLCPQDLEGYAGAGLYDSITMDETELRKVDYGEDRFAALCFPHGV